MLNMYLWRCLGRGELPIGVRLSGRVYLFVYVDLAVFQLDNQFLMLDPVIEPRGLPIAASDTRIEIELYFSMWPVIWKTNLNYIRFFEEKLLMVL